MKLQSSQLLGGKVHRPVGNNLHDLLLQNWLVSHECKTKIATGRWMNEKSGIIIPELPCVTICPRTHI